MTLVRRRVRKKERDCALDVKLHVRLSLKSHSFVVSLRRFLSLTHPPRQVLQADTVLSLSLFFALTKTMYKHTRMANSLSLYHTHTFPQAYSFSLPFLSQTNKNMSLSPSFSSCLSLSLYHVDRKTAISLSLVFADLVVFCRHSNTDTFCSR